MAVSSGVRGEVFLHTVHEVSLLSRDGKSFALEKILCKKQTVISIQFQMLYCVAASLLEACEASLKGTSWAIPCGYAPHARFAGMR